MFRCFDCNNSADDGRALVENGQHPEGGGLCGRFWLWKVVDMVLVECLLANW